MDEPNQAVEEAGGIAPIQPATADRQLLFRVRGTVKITAPPEQTFAMLLNQADVSPAHDTLLFNNSQPIQASYEVEPIVVKASAWQNLRNRFDVTANGVITGLDAVTIINRLNLQGPAILPLPGGTVPTDDPMVPLYPAPFYDVNGDGRVTAADALLVIAELNAGRGGVVQAASDDSSSIVAPPPLRAASTDDGVPLASSLDVTPVAISVASTGSTAVAPSFVAAQAASEKVAQATSAAVTSAIVDLFAGEDDDAPSVTANGSPPAAAPVAELFGSDDRWYAPASATDDPTTIALASGCVDELDDALEAVGLARIAGERNCPCNPFSHRSRARRE